MDDDVEAMTREELIVEARRLRAGIRVHRDSTGHALCWHHPALWGLLPERTDAVPTVPAWPEFLRGCLRYRESLDEQLPDAPRSSNEIRIRALVENWASAVRAKDMAGVLANHDEDIVMFDVPMPLQSRGMQEYRKTWELFFDHNSGGSGSFDVAELRIVAGESVAYCHALVTIFDSKVRITMGLCKEGEQWLIAHEHHSYPIELSPGQ